MLLPVRIRFSRSLESESFTQAGYFGFIIEACSVKDTYQAYSLSIHSLMAQANLFDLVGDWLNLCHHFDPPLVGGLIGDFLLRR